VGCSATELAIFTPDSSNGAKAKNAPSGLAWRICLLLVQFGLGRLSVECHISVDIGNRHLAGHAGELADLFEPGKFAKAPVTFPAPVIDFHRRKELRHQNIFLQRFDFSVLAEFETPVFASVDFESTSTIRTGFRSVSFCSSAKRG
jgi:hypothetical protein